MWYNLNVEARGGQNLGDVGNEIVNAFRTAFISCSYCAKMRNMYVIWREQN